MGSAPSLVINLPGHPFQNFPSVATLTALRQVTSSGLAPGANYVVDGGAAAGDGGGGVFTWSPSLTSADDGVSVIRPSDRAPGQAGRWIQAGGSVDALSSALASSDADKGAEKVGFNPSSDAPAGTAAEFLQRLNQPSTGKFYAEDGARIQRFRDRVFGGAAAKHNGTNDGVQPDWLTTFLISLGRTFGFQHITTFAILSELNAAGQNAILGAARTSDLAAVGNSIGILGVGVNNNSVYSTGAWGGVF